MKYSHHQQGSFQSVVPLSSVPSEAGNEHTPEGSAVSSEPDRHWLHREMVLPAPCEAGAAEPGSLRVEE